MDKPSEDTTSREKHESGGDCGENPWFLTSLSNFLKYCCAECDFKASEQSSFICHAITNHPKSKEAHWLWNDVDCDNLIDPLDNCDNYGIKEDQDEVGNVNSDSDEKVDERVDLAKLEDESSDNNLNDVGRESVSQGSLYEIISNVIGSVRFKCSVCDYKSKYKQAVTNHTERVHLKVTHFACNVCGKKFHQNYALKHHKLTVHNGQRRFVCEICGHPCVTKQGLTNHTKNKHGRAKLKCRHCDYEETSEKRFYNHFVTTHAKSFFGSSSREHKCNSCSDSFESELLLRLHKEHGHESSAKFWCEKCGKQFSTRNGLRFHVNGVHEGLKPFKCAQCDKAFPAKGSLDTHVKIVHTKTGSVKCKICGQGTANVFYLRKHMKEVHS